MTRILCLVTAACLISGCNTLQQVIPISDTASIQSQRSASAELALLELEEIDTLIKLNNRTLSRHIENRIEQQPASGGHYKFLETKLYFKRQFIHIESLVNISDKDNNSMTGLVTGEVLLHFSGDRLEWFPHFTQLGISSRNFEFGGAFIAEPTPAFTELTLERINSGITERLLLKNSNAVPLNTVPLGEIQLGASLPGLSPSNVMAKRTLTGNTRVVDSVILIDSTVTSIALDLAFRPGQAKCPSGLNCTMYAEQTFKPKPESIITRVNSTEARLNFSVLKEDFETRTSNFSIAREKPDIALIETRLSFLHRALRTALADLNMKAEFDSTDLSFPRYSATLKPFAADSFTCERGNCPSPTLCETDLTQCKRLRDTRNCKNCTFRNPLNNRCVREEIDTQCESERNLQNTRFDAERNACIRRVENLKRQCEETNARSLRHCQGKSDSDYSACNLIRSSLANPKYGPSLASVETTVKADGSLTASFSNFRIESNLSRFKLDMSLESRLRLQGKLLFQPVNNSHPLAECIEHWSATFNSRYAATSAVNSLMSDFRENDNALTTSWSGFGLTIDAEPSPLKSILKGNPDLFSRCNIGLSINTLEQSLAGNDAGFFLGKLALQVQPLPTTIHFFPATISLNNRQYIGEARLLKHSLTFEIGD